MTIEEAAALFPVLERTAYLNAGTFGPLARPTVEAMHAEQERDLARDGSARMVRASDRPPSGARGRLAALVGAEPEQVALTASTTDGCNIVLAGLGLGPEDEIVTTTDEHFGLLGPLHASGARVVVVPPDPDADSRGGDAAHAAARPLGGDLDDRSPSAARGAARALGVPVLADCAQSVGAVPVDARGIDFLAFSGQKWLCGPDATGGLVVADPERLRVARPGYFSQVAYERTARSRRGPALPASSRTGCLSASVVGLLAALDVAPEWRYEQAAAMTARCRELLDADRARSSPVTRRSSPFRAATSRRRWWRVLAERGIVVREIPRSRAGARVGRLVDERGRPAAPRYGRAAESEPPPSAMCHDDDSAPARPQDRRRRRVLTTTSCSRRPTATASRPSRPRPEEPRAAGVVILPDVRGPLPLLRGAGAALRRARHRPSRRDRLLRPHRGRGQARRRLRVHGARAAGDARGHAGGRRRCRRPSPRERSDGGVHGRVLPRWAVLLARRRRGHGSPARSASTAGRASTRTARPGPAARARARGPILALMGGDDQGIPQEDVDAFEQAAGGGGRRARGRHVSRRAAQLLRSQAGAVRRRLGGRLAALARLHRAATRPSRCDAASAAVRRPSSGAIGCSAAITFAMCSSSSSPSSSAPA